MWDSSFSQHAPSRVAIFLVLHVNHRVAGLFFLVLVLHVAHFYWVTVGAPCGRWASTWVNPPSCVFSQQEEAVTQGKTINKEQEEVLRSKSSVIAAIDELEKLRQPLSSAVAEEVNLAVQRINETSESTIADESNGSDVINPVDSEHAVVEDLLNLIYLGSMFDVKSQNEYTWTMFRRTHERGSCLTYDYVTEDDSADMMLGERDLDLISMAGGLVISRPVDSVLCHKEALQRCVEHAKLWIAKSDQPIGSDTSITYAGLREKLNKIIGSDYFITPPEIKAPVEYASAVGNYASFQMPVDVPAQVEGSIVVDHLQVEDSSHVMVNETYENQSSPDEEHHKAELESQSYAQDSGHTEEQHGDEGENLELKDQQYINNNNNNRRSFHNQRGGRVGGGGGGRKSYSNGRVGRFGGGRGGGGGGTYQNGRNNYYDQQQSGNYYQRNIYNNRGRSGSRGGNGGNSYHVTADHAGNAPVES